MKKVCIFCAETVKENLQLLLNIFFYVKDCVAASRNISMFFEERAAASEKILTTVSERKNVQLPLRTMSTSEKFWSENRLK